MQTTNTSDITLQQLAQAIHTYCGIDMRQNLSMLVSKIAGRLKELGLSYWEYGQHLKEHAEEWDTLVQLITINETYFYREEGHLEELKNVILPGLKASIGTGTLRIWSAACSTGEEPYSIGMMIEESGLFGSDQVIITATDIDKKVLQTASEGWYSKQSFSFRRIPERLLQTYFIVSPDGYKIKDSIRRMVQFRHLNLISDLKLQTLQHDIIFCRNVLIYFDEETKGNIIREFHRLLKPGGYLFLGHADTARGTDLFESVHTKHTFYYRKGGHSH